MTDESPWLWLLLGLAVAATGGFVLYAGLNAKHDPEVFLAIGYAVLTLGGVLVQAAVIALGVSMGMAHHSRRRK